MLRPSNILRKVHKAKGQIVIFIDIMYKPVILHYNPARRFPGIKCQKIGPEQRNAAYEHINRCKPKTDSATTRSWICSAPAGRFI